MLKGMVELVHTDQTVTLSEGDSIHYYSTPEKEMITTKAKVSPSSFGLEQYDIVLLFLAPFIYLSVFLNRMVSCLKKHPLMG